MRCRELVLEQASGAPLFFDFRWVYFSEECILWCLTLNSAETPTSAFHSRLFCLNNLHWLIELEGQHRFRRHSDGGALGHDLSQSARLQRQLRLRLQRLFRRRR